MESVAVNFIFPGTPIPQRRMTRCERRLFGFFLEVRHPCLLVRIQETLDILRWHHPTNKVSIQLELASIVNSLLTVHDNLVGNAGVYPTEMVAVVLGLFCVSLLPPSIEEAGNLYQELFNLVQLISDFWPQMGIVNRLMPIFFEPSCHDNSDLFEEILLDLSQQILRDTQRVQERLDDEQNSDVPVIV
jgi:hypothetical protein